MNQQGSAPLGRGSRAFPHHSFSLDLALSTDIDRLDKLSEPKLNFPAPYLKIAPNVSNAGATVNGNESTLMPFAPKDLKDHY
jgi:hypothetical protein